MFYSQKKKAFHTIPYRVVSSLKTDRYLFRIAVRSGLQEMYTSNFNFKLIYPEPTLKKKKKKKTIFFL